GFIPTTSTPLQPRPTPGPGAARLERARAKDFLEPLREEARRAPTSISADSISPTCLKVPRAERPAPLARGASAIFSPASSAGEAGPLRRVPSPDRTLNIRSTCLSGRPFAAA